MVRFKAKAKQWYVPAWAAIAGLQDDDLLSEDVVISAPLPRKLLGPKKSVSSAITANCAASPPPCFAELIFGVSSTSYDADLAAADSLHSQPIQVDIEQLTDHARIKMRSVGSDVQVHLQAPSIAAARGFLDLIVAKRLALTFSPLDDLDRLLTSHPDACAPNAPALLSPAGRQVTAAITTPLLYATAAPLATSTGHRNGRTSSHRHTSTNSGSANSSATEAAEQTGGGPTVEPFDLPPSTVDVVGPLTLLTSGVAAGCSPRTAVSNGSCSITGARELSAAVHPARHLSRCLTSLLAETDGPHGAAPSSSGAAMQPDQIYILQIGLGPATWQQEVEDAEAVARRPWQRQLLAVLHWLLPHLAHDAGLSHDDARDGAGTSSLTAAMAGAPSQPPAAFDASQLYRQVKPGGREPMFCGELPELLPTLRPYQRRAVHWMLGREGVTAPPPPPPPPSALEESLHAAPLSPPHPTTSASFVAAATAAAPVPAARSAKTADEDLHPLWIAVGALPPLSGRPATARHAASHARVPAASQSLQQATTSDKPAPQPLHTSAAASIAGQSESADSAAGCNADVDGMGAAGVAFYLNPWIGVISRQRFGAAQCGAAGVTGGILCDEMGLGKTVELLACIVANRFSPQHQERQHGEPSVLDLRRASHATASTSKVTTAAEHIDCVCGLQSDDINDGGDYEGLWLCCDACSAWMHAACLGMQRAPAAQFVCRRCLRAQASEQVLGPCGATLVVVPSPILLQWRDEIARHTRPGALRVVMYDGQDQDTQRSGEGTGGGSGGLAVQTAPTLRPPRGRSVAPRGTAARSRAVSGMAGRGRGPRRSANDSDDDSTSSEDISSEAVEESEDSEDSGDVLGDRRVRSHKGRGVAGGRKGAVRKGDVPAAESDDSEEESATRRVKRRKGGRGGGARRLPADEARSVPTIPQVVTAAALASADIVLTTYDVLQRDVARQPDLDAPQDKGLRYQKRYEVLPTPLTRLRWWRVVLDEAQMVESSTARATQMALKLSTVHRWCVTGTPITRGLEDVYGLVSFLGCRPWSSHTWWVHVMQRPAEAGQPAGIARLLQLLRPAYGGLMWRTAKKDVAAELGVPQQHSHLTHLNFSAVERHWYSRQHAECAQRAREALPAALLAAAAGAAAPPSTSPRAVVDASPQPAVHASLWATAAAERVAGALPAGADEATMSPGAPAGMLNAAGRTHDSFMAAGGISQSRGVVTDPGAQEGVGERAACAMDDGGGGGAEAAGADGETQLGESGILGGGSTANGDRKRRMSTGAAEEKVAARYLTVSEQKKLLLPLLRLRQACCHPQVGAGGIRAVTSQRAPMTMDDILDVLLTKAKVEAEEGQRQLVAALNGLAALMLIEDQQGQARGRAIEAYREALAVMDANRGQVDSDPLQRLHTLHNLSCLLTAGVPPGVARTLRDDSLGSEAEAIRDKYLAQRAAQLASVSGEVDKQLSAASPFKGPEDGWYLDAAALLIKQGYGDEMVDQVRAMLLEKDQYRGVSVNASSIARLLRGPESLKMVLSKQLASIESAREAAMAKMDALAAACTAPSRDFIEQAGACGRCRSELGVQGRLCEHCALDELLLAWEVRLFHLESRAATIGGQVTAEEAARRAHQNLLRRVGRGGLNEKDGEAATDQASGSTALAARRDGNEGAVNATVTWQPSQAEQALKVVLGLLGRYGREYRAQTEQVLSDGRCHLKRLEAQRLLFGRVRSLSLAQRTLLYAYDELDMAVMQIRLRAPGEQVLPHEAGFKLHFAEVPVKNVELSADKATAQADMRRTLGTLRYLQTLKAARRRSAATRKSQHVAAAASAAPTDPLDALCVATPSLPVEQGASASGDAGQPTIAPAPSLTALPIGLPSHDGRAGTLALARGAAGPTVRPLGAAGGVNAPGQPVTGHAADPEDGAASAAEQQARQLLEWRRQQHDRLLRHQQLQQQGGQQAGPSGATGAAADCSTAGGCSTFHTSVSGTQEELAVAAVAGPEDVCPICHDTVGGHFFMFPCGHIVCADCCTRLVGRSAIHFSSSASRHVACPTCRNRALVADIAAVDAGCAIAGDAAAPGQAVGGPAGSWRDVGGGTAEVSLWEGERDVHVMGQYGSKMEALVRRLMYITRSDLSAKILVFSSWIDCLELLSHALAANHVHHLHAKGRHQLQQALKHFKVDASDDATGVDGGGGGGMTQPSALAGRLTGRRNGGKRRRMASGLAAPAGSAAGLLAQDAMVLEADPSSLSSAGASSPPRVLLLAVSQGGAGLNLTEAQHVVLVEPLMDPAAEMQCIGRVHRIGQQRETHVHRFVVRHTIEENVHALAEQRAAGMDMASAGAGGRRGGAGRATGGTEGLTVQDVALLLRSGAGAHDGANTGAGGL